MVVIDNSDGQTINVCIPKVVCDKRQREGWQQKQKHPLPRGGRGCMKGIDERSHTLLLKFDYRAHPGTEFCTLLRLHLYYEGADVKAAIIACGTPNGKVCLWCYVADN